MTDAESEAGVACGGGEGREGELPVLLARAAKGDQNAWRSLIARYGRRVYALARSRRLTHDSAEEITQSVFATLATKLIPPPIPTSHPTSVGGGVEGGVGGYIEQGRFEPWLFRIAMNRVRDELRRQRRHAAPTDPYQFTQVIDSAEDGAARPDPSELARLRAALERLSEPDREVIELRHHAGLDFKKIAEILGEPVGTVLARRHRALRKLRDLMESADRPGASEGRP